MEPREIAASAHLHDADLPHDGVPLDLLAENDDAIGDRVDWVVLDLRLRMLADQERRGFPGGEVNGQSVDEVLKRQLSTVRIARRPDDRTERVHDHQARIHVSHRADDLVEHRAEPSPHQLVAEREEADHAVDLRRVEEAERLLVAEHLERRLADHGQVEARSLGARVGEHQLVSERRLAGAGGSDNEVEGQFGEPSAQHVVESGNPGR